MVRTHSSSRRVDPIATLVTLVVMMRLLPSLLMFVFPVLADEVAPPANPKEAAPAAAPAIVKEALIGKWHLDTEVGGVRVKAVTEYKADGAFQSDATVVMDGESTEMAVKGTWKFDGNALITTVTESDTPGLLPVGEVSKDEILELSETVLSYRDEDGLVVRETRAEAAAKAAAEIPGKPVPPEEVKAINAAITAMERSFREADYDGIAKGTHPSLIAKLGGEEKFRKSLESAVGMMRSGKVKISEAQLEVPAELYEAGDEWVCFVPKRNTVEVEGQTVRSVGFFVAIRKKAEKEWKLLDGAGLRRNPEMLWALLPELPRDVKLPENKNEVLGE